MQTITDGGVSVTEQTAVAVIPQRPASPSVVMTLTAADRLAMASRKRRRCSSNCIVTSRCRLLQQLIQHVDIGIVVQMRHRPAVLVVLGQAAIHHRHHFVHVAGALRLTQALQANFILAT